MTALIEIIIMSVVIYYFISLFLNTRAMDVAYGLLALLAFFAITFYLRLPVLQKIIVQFFNIFVIALIVLFQPELRLALSKLSMKGRRYREITEFDKLLEGISQSIYRLAEKRSGAIVILENQDSLDQYAREAVILNANFSPELLESIFSTSTPVHDGAVIIQGTKILSAATILPLADGNPQIVKSMGTRHRAALGISQLTDALVIVVSEETGKVAIARDGIITRGVKIDRFKGILRSIFTPPTTIVEGKMKVLEYLKSFWEQLKQWMS